MKVCVGCAFPGGLDADIIYPFEDSELFDYYEIQKDGRLEHTAQTRRCLCADLVEPVVRRGIDAVVIKDLTSNSLFKFASAGVRVFLTRNSSVRTSLDMLRTGELGELGLRDLSRRSRKEMKAV